jgi:hypothetical protein
MSPPASESILDSIRISTISASSADIGARTKTLVASPANNDNANRRFPVRSLRRHRSPRNQEPGAHFCSLATQFLSPTAWFLLDHDVHAVQQLEREAAIIIDVLEFAIRTATLTLAIKVGLHFVRRVRSFLPNILELRCGKDYSK